MRLLLLMLLSAQAYASQSDAEIILSPQDLERCEMAKESAKEGDVIFIDTWNPVLKKLSQTTGGWATHNGIVVEENGELIIIESNIPKVKKREFCEFFKKAYSHYEIMRVKFFGPSLIAEVVEEAKKSLGIGYDIGFDYRSDKMFCSKFIHKIFLSGMGVEIGRVTTFEDLLESNPDSPVGFWKTYFLGRIPWKRRTITPQSQYLDEDFESVYFYEVPADERVELTYL